MRVLLIEADPTVAKVLTQALGRELIEVRCVPTLPPSDFTEDVVVLGLPDGDRLAMCRALHAERVDVHVVVLTLGGTEPEAVAALEAGADHVVARQGVSGRELAVRIRAVARRRRRPAPPAPPVLEVGELLVHREHREVRVNGQAVYLSSRETDLLLALARKAGRTIERDVLVDEVWGDGGIDLRSLDSVVKRLRARLGRAGAWIETVRGVGYRLKVPSPAPGAGSPASRAAPGSSTQNRAPAGFPAS